MPGTRCEDALWYVDKTPASVDFVKQAEPYLFGLADPTKYLKLQEEITKVKSGEKVFTEYVEDLEAYVDNL